MKELLNSQTQLTGLSPFKTGEFTVENKPIIIRAFGLEPDDLVCIKSIKKTQNGPTGLTNNDCGFILPLSPLITGEQDFVDCGVKVCICKKQPWTVIKLTGMYRLEVSGSGFDTYRSVTIEASEYTGTLDISCCEQCKVCLPEVTTYCPSQPLLDGGFGFHIADPKDPAATVELTSCPGDTTTDSIWLYPTAGKGHTVKVLDCEKNVLGYAANQSNCAPPYIPQTNITFTGQKVVAAGYDDNGKLTITNSDGSIVQTANLVSC
jgi:hypothetical protein